MRLGTAALAGLLVTACSRGPVAPIPNTDRPEAQADELAFLPEGWRTLTDLPPDSEELRRKGASLFTRACAPCHGSDGRGDGSAAAACDPKPADFLDGKRLEKHSDPFLFYRITKGKPHTCMPAFSTTLSRGDRLVLVRHLRNLDRDAAASAKTAAKP